MDKAEVKPIVSDSNSSTSSAEECSANSLFLGGGGGGEVVDNIFSSITNSGGGEEYVIFLVGLTNTIFNIELLEWEPPGVSSSFLVSILKASFF